MTNRILLRAKANEHAIEIWTYTPCMKPSQHFYICYSEFNAFPMQYAFSDSQFAEGMAALGLTPADTDKIYKAPGGGFYRREDSQRLKDMLDKFDRELSEAIAADKTGEGFIYEMFLTELENHEYSDTRDTEETLEVLGYTSEEVLNDPRLKRGIEKAVTEICGWE